ncbi:MAG: xanthine dehydrogenase family protein molybdopterin-binding subunit, partial [Kiloniellales bacterium]
LARFGVGQGLRRVDDERLLVGAGRYSVDMTLENALHGFVLRSPLAHAEIAGIDRAAAKAAPGVVAVYTIEDLDAAGIGPNPCVAPMPGKNGTETVTPPRPILARGRVRHVGDPVAFVIAETLNQARDAAEMIVVDYSELPSVTDTAAAVDPSAPQIWEEAPGNVAVDYELGDSQATTAAFAKAARTVALELVNNRVVVNAMEPRAALATVEAGSGRLTLYTSTQGSHSLRALLARQILNIPSKQLRVVTPDVGGGFGMKLFAYAEQVLVLFAARALERSVRWTAERGESFLSDSQGRDHVSRAELALDGEGRILALRASTIANLGAYLSNFSPYVATNAARMMSGLYRIPAIYAEIKAVFTNSVPTDAYRGAGRPEAAYLVERLVDYAASEIGLDPAEFRRRNFIPASALPYTTPTGITYDSGDYAEILRRALEAADVDGLDARKADSRKHGRLRGLGIATYVEACGASGKEMARIALDPDGGITLTIGTQTNGQGHATAYTQLLHDKLGFAPEMIRVRQGDSDALSFGGGTGGSRSLLMGGSATLKAAEQVIAKATAQAGQLLEAAEADLEFKDGAFTVVGTDKRVDWTALATASRANGAEAIDESAEFTGPPNTYPNGCHVCELEVEQESGRIVIARYLAVDDFGKVVNPLLAAGQVTGGVVQGIGQALHERTVYDSESGQLVTGSLMDYCLPRADDLPPIEVTFAEDWPCVTNDMGVKGAGEAGSIGAPPAVINALCDALKPLGVRHVDMPATPERVWRAMQNAKAG